MQDILNAVRCLSVKLLATSSAGQDVLWILTSTDNYAATAEAVSAARQPRDPHCPENKLPAQASLWRRQGASVRASADLHPRAAPALRSGLTLHPALPRRSAGVERGGDEARPPLVPALPRPPRRQASPRARAPPRGREEPPLLPLPPLRSPAQRWGSGRRPRSWAMR